MWTFYFVDEKCLLHENAPGRKTVILRSDYLKWYDEHFGTPCEQIRHQQEIERLTAERDELQRKYDLVRFTEYNESDTLP